MASAFSRKVEAIIANCSNSYHFVIREIPEVYNGFESTIYKRDFKLYHRPYYPLLNMGVDAGPNNIVSIASESGSPIIAFRQYAGLEKYAEPVRGIIAMLREQQEARV